MDFIYTLIAYCEKYCQYVYLFYIIKLSLFKTKIHFKLMKFVLSKVLQYKIYVDTTDRDIFGN